MILKRLSICLGAAVFSSAIHAGEIDFSGFGSVIAGMKDSDKGDSYAGYSEEHLTFEPDSLFGLQAAAEINDKVSASIQLLAKGANDWDAQVDWAYVSYKVTDNLVWRAGRIRVPFFLYSDFVTVGYAYPWITPPFEIYSSPFTNLDGVDVVYRHTFGTVDMLFQAYVGSDSFTVDENFGAIGGVDGEVQNQFGLVAEANWRDFRVRYAYHAADVVLEDIPTEPLAQQLDAFGLTTTANRLRYDGDYYDFHDLAFQYDNGSLLLILELAIASAHDEAPGADEFGYYFTAGYRFSNVLLAATYARRDDDKPTLNQELDPSNPLYGIIDMASEALADDDEQTTLTLRWDFSPGMAFKAEVLDRTDNKNADNDALVTRTGIQFVF